jgi:predicted nucleotidyltransferase
MRVAAVICEYNPFHHGHAYQLAAARRDCSADVVLCVMSEYLTQRGELAVADPYTRAEAAILGGADVVVGLPFPYSGASAEFFATAGVRIADALGATHLHFGSECGDLDTLQRLADLLGTSTFADALTTWQRTHPDRGIMAAREAVLRQLCPDAPLPDGSNDLLALAYLTAIATQKSRLIPVTVARNGQDYRDDTDIGTTYASASALRRLWQSSKELSVLQSRLPSGSYAALLHAVQAGNAPADADRLLAAVQLFLRRSDPAALSTLAELGGGLAQRMITAARASAYQTLLLCPKSGIII